MKILNTGMRGINTLTGEFEGLPLGRASLWLSLPNNFGRGMLHTLVCGALLCNEPDQRRYYGAVVVSTESTITMLYDWFYEQFNYQEQIDELGYRGVFFPEFVPDAPIEFKRDYIQTLAMENQWDIRFVTPKDGEFDEHALTKEINLMVEEAAKDDVELEVKLVVMDNVNRYLPDPSHPHGRVRAIRQLATTLGFHLAVCDSLNTEAGELAKVVGGPLNFLNIIRGKSYSYDNRMEYEFDQVFHVHLGDGEGEEKRVYVSIDKNRILGIPKHSGICAYPLEQNAFIPLDMERDEMREFEPAEEVASDK